MLCFIAGEEARKRFKNLRDTFRKELKKIKTVGRSGSEGGTQHYFGSWPYFKSLIFLKDQVVGRKSSGSSSFIRDVDVDNEDTETSVRNESECFSFHLEPENESSLPPEKEVPSRKRKRNEDDFNLKMLALEERKLKMMEDDTKKDDVDHFLSSLAPAIRAMDGYTQSFVKLKIMDLIHNTQYPPETRYPTNTQYQPETRSTHYPYATQEASQFENLYPPY